MRWQKRITKHAGHGGSMGNQHTFYVCEHDAGFLGFVAYCKRRKRCVWRTAPADSWSETIKSGRGANLKQAKSRCIRAMR
jgi:hypothetical protein